MKKYILLAGLLASLRWAGADDEMYRTFWRVGDPDLRTRIAAELKCLGVTSTPSKAGLALVFHSKDKDVVYTYLSTILEGSRPQIRFTSYTIQVNTDASDYSGTMRKVQTIQHGLDFVRANTLWLRRQLVLLALNPEVPPPTSMGSTLELSRDGKFAKESMTLCDICLRLTYRDRVILKDQLRELRDKWQKRLTDQKTELTQFLPTCENDAQREEVEKLLELLERLERRAIQAKPEFGMASNFGKAFCPPQQPEIVKAQLNTISGFLDCFQDCQLDLENLKTYQAATDALLRLSIEAIGNDLDTLVMDPFIEWARSITSETDELNFIGKQEVVMTNQEETTATTSAEAYFAFRNEGNRAVERQLAREFVNQVAITPVNLAPLLIKMAALKELPPVFTTVTPGLNLRVTPKMIQGGRETYLKVALINTVEPTYDTTEKANLIRPVSHVQHSKTETTVAVQSYDMFHLGTQALQSTYEGGPAWRIPILCDLPLLGKFLFTGPRRPVTKTQDVLILVRTEVIPNISEFLTQDVTKISVSPDIPVSTKMKAK